MPEAVAFVFSYYAGPTAAAAYATSITVSAYIITAATVPAVGDAHTRRATRRASVQP